MAKLDNASDGDEDEGKHLGVGEVVLNLEEILYWQALAFKSLTYNCSSLDTEAVDEAEKTETECSQDPDSFLRGITLREERFEDVESEGEGLDGANTRSQDDAFYPESDKSKEGSEGEVDVGIVCS